MAAPSPPTTLTPTLIKGLASCDTATRSKSLKTILTHLSTQTLISDDDLKKLWKALFYCMWHSDKIQNQTQLITRLSSLLPTLPFPLSISYFSHFLLTMRREWPGIDHLRLDKFYLLIRHFIKNFFVLMKNSNWCLPLLEEFIRVLEKSAFFFKGDNGLGNGVSYHVVSVFCEEIKPFLPLNLGVLNLLLRPFVGVLGSSDNKVLVWKVRSCVFDCLIKNGRGLLEVKKSGDGGEVDGRDERVLFGTIALSTGFAARFYEFGSSSECLQGNRKVVFGLHEEFLKLEKEKASLGIEVSLPDGGDEMPLLVPVNGGIVEAESSDNKNYESKTVSKEENSKKKKKKKNKGRTDSDGGSVNDANGDTEMVNVSESSNVVVDDGGNNTLELSEALISNLQKQFEKIAAESGLEGDGVSALDDSPTSTVHVSSKRAKKRKRSKSVANGDTCGQEDVEREEPLANTEGKSGKRVRFAMKNNIVWKPTNPLPPQNVRIPPSSTPRGSALKKGVLPGPIRDTALDIKKAKKKKPSPLKKARKVKTISPSVKRAKKKVKPMSA